MDIQNDNDPAIYTNTPQEIGDTRAWLDTPVGTSWMDTSTMDYVPYNSAKVIVDNDTRFRSWGQLYDYASVNIYEWVESDVPPAEWDAVAAQEQGDNTIPEAKRKSGVAKYTLFEQDPTYMGSPPQWIPLKNKVDTQYAATDGPAGSFTINLSIIDNTKAVDVYINEVKQPSVQPAGSPAVLPVTVNLSVKENDVVKFVQAVPTDDTEIAAEIAAGNLMQEYEYNTVDSYDAFGNLNTKYYFWVGEKSTKPSGRNRTLSLAEAAQQLVSVPSAHMFFQKPVEETTVEEAAEPVNRVEYFTISDGAGSPSEHSYELELLAVNDEVISVDIDGVDIDLEDVLVDTDFKVTIPGGSPVGGSPAGTAYDISTAVAGNTSPSITAEAISPEDIQFGDSGTKMYTVDLNTQTVYQYTLGTPYDTTTAVYASKSHNVGTEEVSPLGLTFNDTGSRMYICGTSNIIHQYTLSTPWDVSTAGTVVTGAVGFSGWQYTGMQFNPTGTKLYAVFTSGSNSYLTAQPLGTAYNVSTLGAGTFLSISTETDNATGFHISSDGNYIHVTSDDAGVDGVFQYTLGTAWDETSAVFDTFIDTSSLDGFMSGVTFNDTGSRMYLMGLFTSTVYEYDINIGGAGSPVGGSPIIGDEVTTVTINVPADPAAGGSPGQEQLVKIVYSGVNTTTTVIPTRFTQTIIRGLQGIIFDDSRYTIRFTRDYTLRDNLDIDNEDLSPLEMKNLHEEWKIFRKEQSAKIDRWMWDKITESIVGYKLDDPATRVPAFEYQLYDEKYGTQTQYGLKTNQAFVNGNLALSSILTYLVDPTVDFESIDINVFFSNYNFDTPEDIIASMNRIYDTFPVVNVNRMYFSVLNDAFTTKSKYPGIFKTSMVSLHGIRPFQNSGVFDD